MRPIWSIALYALLVVSAGVALYAQRATNVDPAVARVSPWLFLVFAVGFAIYRVALVAARRYSPFKAFIQIFLAALFFLLLLFPRTQAPPPGSAAAHVRAVQARALVPLLGDADAEVRKAAHDALVKLNGGSDLGADRAAWEARFP